MKIAILKINANTFFFPMLFFFWIADELFEKIKIIIYKLLFNIYFEDKNVGELCIIILEFCLIRNCVDKDKSIW